VFGYIIYLLDKIDVLKLCNVP